MKHNPLDEIRSSLVIMVFIGVYLGLSILITMFMDADGLRNFDEGALFGLDNFFGALSYIMIALLLWQISSQVRDEIASLLFNIPDTSTVKSYIWLSIGIILLSIGLTYFLYYPLSLLAPEWVQYWLLDAPYLLYWDDEGWYLAGNLAGFVLAVIFAPVVEEFLFRGYLLNRWTLKLGALPAMLLSASFFAVLHPDMLGAFVFAVLMSLLYMKTRSLLAPIIVHMSNNFFAVLLEWVDRQFLNGFETTTIADFQAYLPLGVVCLAIGSYWVWNYVKQNFMPVDQLLARHAKGDSDDFSV